MRFGYVALLVVGLALGLDCGGLGDEQARGDLFITFPGDVERLTVEQGATFRFDTACAGPIFSATYSDSSVLTSSVTANCGSQATGSVRGDAPLGDVDIQGTESGDSSPSTVEPLRLRIVAPGTQPANVILEVDPGLHVQTPYADFRVFLTDPAVIARIFAVTDTFVFPELRELTIPAGQTSVETRVDPYGMGLVSIGLAADGYVGDWWDLRLPGYRTVEGEWVGQSSEIDLSLSARHRRESMSSPGSFVSTLYADGTLRYGSTTAPFDVPLGLSGPGAGGFEFTDEFEGMEIRFVFTPQRFVGDDLVFDVKGFDSTDSEVISTNVQAGAN